ncbi:Peptidyl-prolyl cis-trans isomerase PpiD [plant metagenome]|uniref:peptidylprolyl isomerase n=2 Tax=root TaxID=1 RepID=A0A1C3K2P9_9BURK|nr:peptidylprolyl isomerase [Orrella dioscoreae]SBT25782.1 Peptidyl-prolyl cis-trans isomerase PpiD [Orrella dioscoreae]SOE52009.1 Peptidyl-prolyl cis-trans isomerase PpiD [Orrella dioscoreae]
MNAPTTFPSVPLVNGVPLATAQEILGEGDLRQRACTELLRQAAIAQGLLAADDPPPAAGAISQAAADAIERLLDDVLRLPEPSEEACRRHHAAHAARYAVGERVRARHVLFAVTPGVDVNALRQRAEACLLDVRNATPAELAVGDRFAQAAATTSNCPSGKEGGMLGWLNSNECAPEFARELFGHAEVGVLPRLVHSRFGFHVVEVLAREPGDVPAYEVVRAAVVQTLRQQSFATALTQYLRVLAGEATVSGVDLDGTSSPLVQ